MKTMETKTTHDNALATARQQSALLASDYAAMRARCERLEAAAVEREAQIVVLKLEVETLKLQITHSLSERDVYRDSSVYLRERWYGAEDVSLALRLTAAQLAGEVAA